MSNSFVVTDILDATGPRLQKFLEIKDNPSTAEVVKVLLEKGMDINPIHVSVVFCTGTSVTREVKIPCLVKIVKDLRDQGFYIPFPGDKFTAKMGIVEILQSTHHKLGPLPLTKHNVVDAWHWARAMDRGAGMIINRVHQLEEIAKEIHYSYSHLSGWLPWRPPARATGYQKHAFAEAARRMREKDLEAALSEMPMLIDFYNSMFDIQETQE